MTGRAASDERAGADHSAPAPARRRSRLSSWRLWGSAFVLLLAAAAAYVVFVLAPGERAATEATWDRRLSEVSADRARAVANLLKEGADEALVIAQFPSTVAILKGGTVAPRTGEDAGRHMGDELGPFAAAHAYSAIWVFDLELAPVVQWPADAAPDARAVEFARMARSRGTSPTSALWATDGGAQAMLGAASGLAVVVLRIDAAALFAPISGTNADSIERWIVSADGDQLVRFDLRNQEGEAFPQRRDSEPISSAPADLRTAALGGPARDATPDPALVLSSSHPVKGTNWAAVARVDRDAVLGAANAATRERAFTLGAWVLAIGALGFGVIRALRAAHDEALMRSESRFSALIQQSNDPILVLRRDGTIERASERAGEFYRTTAADLVGRTIFDLRPPESRAEAQALLARIVTGGGSIFDAVHVRMDGTQIPVEVSARCIDLDGEIRILASIRDITRRRTAEEHVAAVSRFLRALVAVNEVILTEHDPDTLLARSCAVVAERSGASAAWVGDVDARDGSVRVRTVAGVTRDELQRMIDAIHVNGRQPASAVARDGKCVGVRDTSDPAAGEPAYAVLASAGVRSTAIAPIRRGGALVGVLQLHGVAPGMFEGETLHVVAEVAAALGLALTAIDERRAHEEEQARAAAEIRSSAAREHERATELEAVLDSVPVGVWFAEDAAATRIRGNRYAESILGFPRGTVLSAAALTGGTQPNPIRMPGGRPLTYDEMPMVVAARDGRRIEGLQLEFLRADGSVVHLFGGAAPILDANGAPRGSVGSFLDVTEVRKADARLRVLSRVVEQNTASVVITNSDGVIEYVNPKFEALTGYTLAEARGRTPSILKSGEMPEQVYADLWKTIRAGREWRGELHNKRKDGTLYWEYAVIMPILDEAGRIAHFAAVKEDITLRREAERALGAAQRELAQSQRMEAIGRLAGGIAHDFNNILGVILGYAELSVASVPEGNPLKRNLEEICEAADRAANLTRQLLAFSRRQTVEITVIDLSATTRDVTKMLRRLIGEDIELELDIVGEPCHVRADPGQIEQLVLNLALNSRDAMPNGGKLRVTTSEVDVTPPGRVSHGAGVDGDDGLPPGRYAMLAVADTGTGLSEEVRAHLFEPFFTTKEPGKGTGLGLATLWGVVHGSGGHVRYTTEIGRGTTFRIYLPRVEPVSAESPHPANPESRRGRGESVLVVEDDPAVRSLVERLVAAAGYRVVAVSGVDAAIAAADVAGDSFDIVVSDVVMPKMGGPELVRVLRARKPSLRALFMSGYTERISSQQGELPSGAAFIQKPFTVAKLEAKIREAVDAPVPAA